MSGKKYKIMETDTYVLKDIIDKFYYLSNNSEKLFRQEVPIKLEIDICNYLSKILNLEYENKYYFSEFDIEYLVTYFLKENNISLNYIYNIINTANEFAHINNSIFANFGDTVASIIMHTIAQGIEKLIFK